MAKALPYFKFYCSEWSDGDITLEDMKTQGVFINICAYYWSQECDVFEEKLQKRFKNYTKQIENLKKEKIIFSEDGKIVIRFLNKQWTEREALKQKNQKNGASGGRPKKTQSVNFGKPNENPRETNIEEKREEEKREDKQRTINLEVFDDFRKKYKGTKNGNETEFDNFCKKHKDWKSILPTLSERIDYQIRTRSEASAQGSFVPQWKNLSTWINNRCWEEEITIEQNPSAQTEPQMWIK